MHSIQFNQFIQGVFCAVAVLTCVVAHASTPAPAPAAPTSSTASNAASSAPAATTGKTDAKADGDAKSEPEKSDPEFTSMHMAEISPNGKYVVGYASYSLMNQDFIDLMARLNVGAGGSLSLFNTETYERKGLNGASKWVSKGHWKSISRVQRLLWVGNDRIALQYNTDATLVDLEGNEVMHLGSRVIGKTEPDNPDSPWLITMKADDFYLTNISTKQQQRLRFPMSGTPVQWVFDRKGELRALTLRDTAFWSDKSKLTNWYRAKGAGSVRDAASWVKLAEFAVNDRTWAPVAIDHDDKSLIIHTDIGRDTAAVMLYDVDKRAITETLAAHPAEDILHVTGLGDTTFKSVTTNGMKPNIVWMDRDWGLAQKTADVSLPNRVNRIAGNPKGKILILSYSDVDPGTWYVLDMKVRSLNRFAVYNGVVKTKDARPMEIISYAAKDGLKIPAYLTRPADNARNQPMIVLIHGGPAARDYWGWDFEVQLLAQRGYVVLQPQFRGSDGFGVKFREAGYRQWGRAMQDDITAGVEAMIAQGIADPKRICIYGASYGGYAAMWGLVKTPELYRCGISLSGVSDIGYMLTDRSDSNASEDTREVQRLRVGDLNTSREAFDAVSPLKHAGKVKAPVLLMHGTKDERVPISHGEKLLSALRAEKKAVQWKEFEGEGHGIHSGSNRAVMFDTLIKFLHEHNPTDKPLPEPENKAAKK
jgi:dipeptidyl aminopeptidase/acylaminoacyl peptidase